MFAGEDRGRKMVVFAFDLRQSNLPLSAAFPILMANILGYLQPSGAIESREVRPGAAVSIQPLALADEVEVRTPEGRVERYPIRGRPVVFPYTDSPGLYRVAQWTAGKEVAAEHFAVNLLDESESDIRPRTSLFMSIGKTVEETGLVIVRREVWMWLAALGVAVLVFEWWWYHRRT